MNFPEEAENVRVLHYLNGPFRKHRDNDSIDDVESWISERSDTSDPVERLLVDSVGSVLRRIRSRSQSQSLAFDD